MKIIVLNSVGFVSRTLDLLVRSSKEVILYLDNDLAGRNAKQKLTDAGVTFKDGADLYVGYKDVNKYLDALLKVHRKDIVPKRRSKGQQP